MKGKESRRRKICGSRRRGTKRRGGGYGGEGRLDGDKDRWEEGGRRRKKGINDVIEKQEEKQKGNSNSGSSTNHDKKHERIKTNTHMHKGGSHHNQDAKDIADHTYHKEEDTHERMSRTRARRTGGGPEEDRRRIGEGPEEDWRRKSSKRRRRRTWNFGPSLAIPLCRLPAARPLSCPTASGPTQGGQPPFFRPRPGGRRPRAPRRRSPRRRARRRPGRGVVRAARRGRARARRRAAAPALGRRDSALRRGRQLRGCDAPGGSAPGAPAGARPEATRIPERWGRVRIRAVDLGPAPCMLPAPSFKRSASGDLGASSSHPPRHDSHRWETHGTVQTRTTKHSWQKDRPCFPVYATIRILFLSPFNFFERGSMGDSSAWECPKCETVMKSRMREPGYAGERTQEKRKSQITLNSHPMVLEVSCCCFRVFHHLPRDVDTSPRM